MSFCGATPTGFISVTISLFFTAVNVKGQSSHLSEGMCLLITHIRKFRYPLRDLSEFRTPSLVCVVMENITSLKKKEKRHDQEQLI